MDFTLRQKMKHFYPNSANPETPVEAAPAEKTENTKLAQSAALPQPAPMQPDGHNMLTAIISWLRQYLVCDDHQLTLLALWAVYTWCHDAFPNAVYLNICSPESQSGKTRCLDLLERLCGAPCRMHGGDPATVFRALLFNCDARKKDQPRQSPFTFLFDHCEHTFGPSLRQPLIALLNSGSRKSSLDTRDAAEFLLFGPKAFAGNSCLPRSLAERRIPLLLRRRKPNEAVKRFDLDALQNEAARFVDSIETWSTRQLPALRLAARKAPAGLPANLTPHHQECVEPLLHLADLIGGSWPEKARNAVSAVVMPAGSSLNIDLLADMRMAFAYKENPEYLTTADLTSMLASLEHRPWGGWRDAARKFGRLLHPFAIKSLNLKLPDGKVLKGYLFTDFQDAWERYLPPLPPGCVTKTSPQGSATKTAPSSGPATWFAHYSQ